MDGRGSSCMYAQLRCVRVLQEAQPVLLGRDPLYVIRSDLSPVEKVRIINKELVKEPTPGEVNIIQGEGSCFNHSALL